MSLSGINRNLLVIIALGMTTVPTNLKSILFTSCLKQCTSWWIKTD